MSSRMAMPRHVLVAGAGVAGLSAAIHLQNRGISVTLVDRNPMPGGKLNVVYDEGYRFDAGPSLLTLPEVFADLFAEAGTSLEKELTIVPLDPYCRYFFPDGTAVETSDSMYRMTGELLRHAPEDVDAFFGFLAKAAAWWRMSADSVIYGPPMDWKAMKGSSLDPIAFFRMRPFESLESLISRTFRSERIRRICRLIALYTGSDPRRAPAIFSLIPFLEFGLGRWYVQGGLYEIARVLTDRFVARGGRFHPSTDVERIEFESGRARRALLDNGERIEADAFVVNTDVSTAVQTVVRDAPGAKRLQRRLAGLRPSTSAFVMMLGVNAMPAGLIHHNIVFSSDEDGETRRIFDEGLPPLEPTVYLNNPSSTDPSLAPAGGAALFAMVNVPAIDGARWNWGEQRESYANRVIDRLEAQCPGLRESIEVMHVRTPEDFSARTSAHRGSLYGSAPDSFLSMMKRPRNVEKGFDGVWFAGGTTHPGAGIPLAALSGRLVARQIAFETES